ncbi:MAG: cytosine permease [Candidatus Omnitrophica bacterium]|nr:cytosine permease [Candidatus Omnitrophota bacterium]
MSNGSNSLPGYLSSAKPNPAENRAPWYINTAPSYAGIFLWIAFYDQMAGGTLSTGGMTAVFAGLIIAGFIAYLFYLAPALWGMKTGYPLYIIGSSTFGEKGGYFIPGLFMGILQVGWYGVATFYSTQFVLNAAFGVESAPAVGSFLFVATGFIWGYVFAFLGMKGIQYVAKVSQFFPIVPLIMLIYAAFALSGGLSEFDVTKYDVAAPATGFSTLVLIQIVIGFFATAGAAGADFGMNNRSKKDIYMGGLIGIAASIFICGFLPMLAIAGAMGGNPELAQADKAWTFSQAIGQLAGGQVMFLLFAVASMAPACFCSFIFTNSFSTMIPQVPRAFWGMLGATVGILLAVTGIAEDLQKFFSFIGASFGPVCGAMAADYLLCKGEWPGPRRGINWAGYIAVIAGFIVGILPSLSTSLESIAPAAVYSFIVGFALYYILSKSGLQPQVVEMTRPE